MCRTSSRYVGRRAGVGRTPGGHPPHMASHSLGGRSLLRAWRDGGGGSGGRSTVQGTIKMGDGVQSPVERP